VADWRNCNASLTLVAEINKRWPGRDKKSCGTVGDSSHATRTSDHNPYIVVAGIGVVRARDIDVDGIDAGWLAEYLRQLGGRGDPRLRGGGYVIFNRRITKPDWSGWKAYVGKNPHTSHVHVSFSLDRAGFDSPASWGITTGPTAPAPTTPGGPELDAHERKLLEDIHGALAQRHPTRVDFALLGQARVAQPPTDTAFGAALNADARAYEAREFARMLRTDVGALMRLVESQRVSIDSQRAAIETLAQLAGAGGGATPDQIKAAVTEALRDNVVRVDVAVTGRST
jgi:hypothetical protein